MSTGHPGICSKRSSQDVGGKKLKGEVWRHANTNKIKSGRKKKPQSLKLKITSFLLLDVS